MRKKYTGTAGPAKRSGSSAPSPYPSARGRIEAPMFAISVVFSIVPEHRQDFLNAAMKHAANSRTEKDCLAFEIWTSPDDPALFYFHEVYTSKAAVDDVHVKTAYYAEFGRTTEPWIRSRDLQVWNSAE